MGTIASGLPLMPTRLDWTGLGVAKQGKVLDLVGLMDGVCI